MIRVWIAEINRKVARMTIRDVLSQNRIKFHINMQSQGNKNLKWDRLEVWTTRNKKHEPFTVYTDWVPVKKLFGSPQTVACLADI